MTNHIYNKDSIESLDARDHIRLRPGMYAGDTSNPNHLLVEVFSNSLDEHNIGHGNLININIADDGVVTVEDFGQGFPIGEKRDDGKTVLEASCSVVNTSGKFRDDGVYSGNSVGLNGLGIKLTNFLSTYFKVTSRHDGKQETDYFENGFLKTQKVCNTKLPNGTIIEYKPDKQFFTTDKIDIKSFENFAEEISYLCPQLTIKINGKEINHPTGLAEIFDKTKDQIIENPILIHKDCGKSGKLDLACTFTSNSSSVLRTFVNYGYTESGIHISLLKSVVTKTFNNWARESRMLKEKDKNLSGDSLQEGMVLYCNIKSLGVAYDAQVKSKVTKIDNAFAQVFSDQLEIWMDAHPEDAKKIIEKSLIARKAAEAAKKAREAVKNNQQRKNKKVKILHPDKLKDAEKLGKDSVLLCVEGLSAGASIAVSRDSKSGILMLRGKMINALASSDDRLLKNEEIQLLFQALGIVPHQYKSSDLRYGKVGICSDSDSDGFHIGLLVIAALAHFCPQFIEEGRLCWLRSPLYIVKNKGKQDQYFFTDEDMNAAKKKGIIGTVQRNKGLGSLSAEQARNSMFGKNQRLDVLLPDDKSFDILNQLMGADVAPRKKYVTSHIDFSEIKE